MADKSDPLLTKWGNSQTRAPADSLFGGDYEWPNIFDEANEMLLASIMIYALADLRTLARQGLLVAGENDEALLEQILTLPFSTKEIVHLVSKNRATIVQELGEPATDLYLSAFDLMQETASRLAACPKTGEQMAVASSDVVVCDDENKTEELVYGIWICSARRRITVTFRGCKTMTDWSTAANQFLKNLPNPVESSFSSPSSAPTSSPSSFSPTTGKKECLPASIGLHYGFYSYLNHPIRSGETKFEAILSHLRVLFKQYPGYRLYVTGHSLGGALATIFAFQMGADSSTMENLEIPAPITCVNFASPMVGNLAFKKAFHALERRGRIRCLRVTNSLDIVTRLPDRGSSGYFLPVCLPHGPIEYIGVSCLFFMCVQNHIYRHVGMNLKLYRQGNYKIKFPKESDNPILLAAQDWKTHLARPIQMIMTLPFACCGPCLDYAWCCHIEDFGVNHQARAYRDRLQPLRNEFQDKYLNDLYDDPRW